MIEAVTGYAIYMLDKEGVVSTGVTRLAIDGCTAPEIAALTGHTLEQARSILNAHYLNRDPVPAENAITKLEGRTNTPNPPPNRRLFSWEERGRAQKIRWLGDLDRQETCASKGKPRIDALKRCYGVIAKCDRQASFQPKNLVYLGRLPRRGTSPLIVEGMDAISAGKSPAPLYHQEHGLLVASLQLTGLYLAGKKGGDTRCSAIGIDGENRGFPDGLAQIENRIAADLLPRTRSLSSQ